MTARARPGRARRPWPVPPSPLPQRTLVAETGWVLLAGLGASAVYSLLALVRKLLDAQPLSAQVTPMNSSQAPQPWLDLVYQLVGIGLGLVTVGLALHVLGREFTSPSRQLGLDLRRPVPDLLRGLLLAAIIGLPGLGLYLGARALGMNTEIAAAGLGEHWWSIPVLIVAAVQNAVLEEVVMVGYLVTRWSQAGWRVPEILLASALIRGCYHLYQGFGGGLGNVLMGLILGAVYLRTRRVMPLVICHAVLDIVAFVGYRLVHDHVGWL